MVGTFYLQSGAVETSTLSPLKLLLYQGTTDTRHSLACTSWPLVCVDEQLYEYLSGEEADTVKFHAARPFGLVSHE